MDHEEFVPNIVKLLGRMDKAKAPAHLTIAFVATTFWFSLDLS